jgi:hypothetical protein
MVRPFVLCLIVGLCNALGRADEPKVRARPITEAESVLAVYREDWGLASSGGPAIILAAWPDGQIVWSKDRLNGGTPYFAGSVDPKKVAALLSRFEKVGLFADEKLNRAHFGPDSQFNTVLVKSGKKQVKMQSWHELNEVSDNIVADHRGAVLLEGRRRLDELRKAPADYLFFRAVWSETRTELSDLIPGESVPTTGRPAMKAGVLSWLEGAVTAKSNGFGEPPRK